MPAESIADVELLVPSELADAPAEVIYETQALAEVAALEPCVAIDERGRWRRLRDFLTSVVVGSFGAVTLIVGLAMLATVPVLNLLSLGYLLEASGRVARTRRLSAGFIGLRTAAAVGGVVFAAWLARWPVLLVADLWRSSHLIDPGSGITKGWAIGWTAMVLGLGLLTAAVFLGSIWLRPGTYARMRDEVWRLATQRLPYYFWLGLRGFIGGMIWLLLPISVLASAAFLRPEPGALVSLLGGLMLIPVLMYLPFLQTHFAAQNRFGAMFELGTVRRMFRRAPIAFWMALFITLLFALPLYLLMIEALPREVTWLPSVVFVMFLFPARLLTGWAYARAAKREQPRFFLFRWLARLGMLPVAVTYAFFVWLSQYLLWYGVFSLYHQHAFLVPVPFMAM